MATGCLVLTTVTTRGHNGHYGHYPRVVTVVTVVTTAGGLAVYLSKLIVWQLTAVGDLSALPPPGSDAFFGDFFEQNLTPTIPHLLAAQIYNVKSTSGISQTNMHVMEKWQKYFC
eukprot:scaffold486_cov148-Skeletonema_dohrnii-CCMP3373.AAC.28